MYKGLTTSKMILIYLFFITDKKKDTMNLVFRIMEKHYFKNALNNLLIKLSKLV